MIDDILQALIFGLRCSDGLEDSNHQHDEEVQVFRLELLFKVVLQNRFLSCVFKLPKRHQQQPFNVAVIIITFIYKVDWFWN